MQLTMYVAMYFVVVWYWYSSTTMETTIINITLYCMILCLHLLLSFQTPFQLVHLLSIAFKQQITRDL